MNLLEKVYGGILTINKVERVADSTFESLKQNHSDTLDKIFAKLTGRDESNHETDAIMNAFD